MKGLPRRTIVVKHGVARLYIQAIGSVDYPTIMAVVMAIGAGVAVMNIVADIVYGVLDPCVRYD